MLVEHNYSLQEVLGLCVAYMNGDHLLFVQKAAEYARQAHEGQYRKSGEEYFIHPTQVAGILAELKMDPATVATGFLHDVVEDTEATLEDISREFSPDVAQLVDGVTKLGKIEYQSKEAQQAENHRKMLLAMSNDLRVILVKLADRLHNMRTLEFHRPEKQQIIARETLEIYAPLAERLGISRIKWELEDISLRYLNPQQYYRIVHLMNQRRDEREAYIQETIEAIQDGLDELEIEAEITGRPKHIYSIYRKMVDQHKQFDEIYDLSAVRVIATSVRDCYAVLGMIHTKWKPLPNRFKDYIAMPKDNLYQSLHTTVLGPKAQPVEVQIRTEEMHEIAEYGVAAHWAYKEGIKQKVNNDELGDHISWFRDLQELQSNSSDAEDFMDSVKQDILKDKVYVFTPDSDVFELPAGASTLDFAYHIHTEVGNKSTGAKVNGRIVPLNYKLKTGDIVEIITSKTSYGPSRDWLGYVNTSKARNRIKRYFKVSDRQQHIQDGKEMLDRAIDEAGFSHKQILTRKNIDQALDRYNYKSEEELYAAIGFGELRLATVVNYLTQNAKNEKAEKEKTQLVEQTGKAQEIQVTSSQHKPEKLKIQHDGGVVVEGADNLLIRMSRCCNPVPGDEIVGYITKGRGISVHRQDCPNVANDSQQERLIEVEWDSAEIHNNDKKNYQAELQIESFNRNGLLNEILQVIQNGNNTISDVSAKIDNNDYAVIKLVISISNTKELVDIVDKIKSVPDVYTVQRVVS